MNHELIEGEEKFRKTITFSVSLTGVIILLLIKYKFFG
jgi:hypothetical protein